MSIKELQDKIVNIMEKWKKIENNSVASTGQVIDKTDNPLVRLVMEIIQNDSQMHYRVQDFIKQTLTSQAVSLTPEELGSIWGLVENHIKIEENTISMAKEALDAISGKKMTVQEYLLTYMLRDEKKHEAMLSDLASIKKGMYPYG